MICAGSSEGDKDTCVVNPTAFNAVRLRLVTRTKICCRAIPEVRCRRETSETRGRTLSSASRRSEDSAATRLRPECTPEYRNTSRGSNESFGRQRRCNAFGEANNKSVGFNYSGVFFFKLYNKQFVCAV